jgi:hypothetical protein
LNFGVRPAAGIRDAAKIKQSVRKLAFRLKMGSLSADFCDRLASDRSKRAKIR